VPKPGQTINPRELIAFARERIGDFKVPQYVVVRELLLPRNAGGKILKAPLRNATIWGEPIR
jgi:acyl-CoA synthetase (AMP-forming)/AMP-acid ligase II